MKEFWSRHKSKIGLAILVIYVVSLGVATADEIFDLGLFPTKLDRMIEKSVDKLESPDPAVREQGAKELLEYGDFAVPQLIEALDDPGLRGPALEILARVTEQEFGSDVSRWKEWYNAHKDDF